MTMTDTPIYLDHAATTPLLAEAAEAMASWLTHQAGNPSSLHEAGVNARLAISRARATVAECLHAPSVDSITFTSGATEASNWIIKGVADGWQATHPGQQGHLIISAIEHDAVLKPAEYLRDYRGWQLTLLPVDSHGMVSPAQLAQAIQPNTALVSIIHGNNEIGSLQPLAKLVDIAHQQGVLFHSDGVQTVGKLSVDVQALGVDYLTWSGHKFYGPKGVGGAYCKPGSLVPMSLIHGGGQENTHRSGTENVAAIVGMATALAYQRQRLPEYRAHLVKLDKAFNHAVSQAFTALPAHIVWNTPQQALHLPGINHVSIIPDDPNTPPLEGETLLLQLDLRGIQVSSGSACHNNSPTAARLVPSRMVMALLGIMDSDDLVGDNLARCMATLRFSGGWHTTPDDMVSAAQQLAAVVNKLVKSPVPTS